MLWQWWTSSITQFLACYKSLSALILNMEGNSIDINVKTENLINAVQNEPSIWNTKLNSSAIFTYTTNTGQVTLLRSGQWGSCTRTSLRTLLAWWTLKKTTRPASTMDFGLNYNPRQSETKLAYVGIAGWTARCRCKFRYVSNFWPHCAVSLPQHGFFVGLCLQTAVNYLSKSDRLKASKY